MTRAAIEATPARAMEPAPRDDAACRFTCDHCDETRDDVEDAYADALFPVPALFLCPTCRDAVAERQAGMS